jgi:plastocyanin
MSLVTRQAEIHHAPHLLRLLIAFTAAVLMPVALSGAAGASSANSTRTWTVQVGSESSNQAIQGMAFLPENIYVNAGDKVVWKANSAEIHTVTFLAKGQSLDSTQPFNPTVPAYISKQGGKSYDGQAYYNSGIMTNVSNSGFNKTERYSLTFTAAGDFTYYSLVHGKAVEGTVHVRDAGTAYPYSQSQYDRASKQQERKIIRDGYTQWDAARVQADDSKAAHTVVAGTDNETAMVMRYVHQKISVHVGDEVTFVNTGMGAPHTVTFGAEPEFPFPPVGDRTNYTGGDLNSGIMDPHTSFTVKFNKAGKFHYICAFHDYMGMEGDVTVHA